MAESLSLSNRSASATPVNADSVPAYLFCNACAKLLINCLQTTCGCRICRACMVSILHPTEMRSCPGSGTAEDDSASHHMTSQATCFPDTGTRQELLHLTVRCPNVEDGCQMQMKWKDLEQHLNLECDHEIVICNLCLNEIVQHKLQSSHRNLQSDECCPNFHAPCPQCGDTSRRLNPQEFTEHQKTCPSGQADCKYACVGCNKAMKRCQLSEHYSSCTDEHLERTVKRLLQHEIEQKNRMIDQMENQNREAQLQFQNLLTRLEADAEANQKKADQRMLDRLDSAEAVWKKVADDLRERVRCLEEQLVNQGSGAEKVDVQQPDNSKDAQRRHSRHLSLTETQLNATRRSSSGTAVRIDIEPAASSSESSVSNHALPSVKEESFRRRQTALMADPSATKPANQPLRSSMMRRGSLF